MKTWNINEIVTLEFQFKFLYETRLFAQFKLHVLSRCVKVNT